MDPNGQRPIGSGELIVSVVAAPICQQNPLLGFPASGTAYAGCGGYVTESVGSIAPGICRAETSKKKKALKKYFIYG